jgi:hypothetical protein
MRTCASSSCLTNRASTLLAAAGAIAVLVAAGTAWPAEQNNNDEVFAITKVVQVPCGAAQSPCPLNSFDISWVDPVLHRYYLGDRSHKAVDVIDTMTDTISQFTAGFVGFIGSNDTSGPDGVLTVDHKELWVGDGMSRVWVLDASTGAVLTLPNGVPNPIPTSTNDPKRADELCYDSTDHLVMIANNADDPPFASLISTETYTVVGHIPFDGTNGAPKSTNGAEQCQWSSATGKFYITVPGVTQPTDDGTGVVAVIDPKVKKVVQVFPIPLSACATPQGMAMGPSNQILVGCNGSSTNGKFSSVIINQNSGAIIKVVPNESGPDEVWYNPGDGHYFLARSAAYGPPPSKPIEINSQLGIIDSAGKRGDQSVVTANPGKGAHSVAADPDSNQVYVPIPANGGQGACGLSYEADGCIAVLTTTHNDHSRIAVERGPDDNRQ